MFERDGKSYLQLDTYGSADRKIPGKVSQSIQFLDSDCGVLLDAPSTALLERRCESWIVATTF